jgi:hypothetical protein
MASYPPPTRNQATFNYKNFVNPDPLTKQQGDVRYAFKSQGVTPETDIIAKSLTLSGTESDHGSTTFGTKNAYDVVIQGATPNVTGGTLTQHGPILLGKRDSGAFTYSGTVPDASYSYLLDTGSELVENTKNTKKVKINGNTVATLTSSGSTLAGTLNCGPIISSGTLDCGGITATSLDCSTVISSNGLTSGGSYFGPNDFYMNGTGYVTSTLAADVLTALNSGTASINCSGQINASSAAGRGFVTGTSYVRNEDCNFTGPVACGAITSSGPLSFTRVNDTTPCLGTNVAGGSTINVSPVATSIGTISITPGSVYLVNMYTTSAGGLWSSYVILVYGAGPTIAGSPIFDTFGGTAFTLSGSTLQVTTGVTVTATVSLARLM